MTAAVLPGSTLASRYAERRFSELAATVDSMHRKAVGRAMC
jgi:hypothetical protein